MRKKKIHEGEMKRERGLHGDQNGSWSGSQGWLACVPASISLKDHHVDRRRRRLAETMIDDEPCWVYVVSRAVSLASPDSLLSPMLAFASLSCCCTHITIA